MLFSELIDAKLPMGNDENFLQKLARYASEQKFAAVACSLAFACLTYFLSVAKDLPGARDIQYGCGSLVVVSGIAAAIGYLRDAKAARARSKATSAKSIKGLVPFFESEQELFMLLGSSVVVDRLLSLASDDQDLLLILVGDRFAGKSSVLRAGLRAGLTTHNGYYCQADSGFTLKEFEKKVQDYFGVTIDQLLPKIKPSGTTAPDGKTTTDGKSSVVIIDHFDFLRQGPLSHDDVFEKLRQLCIQPAPYGLKVVICFRKEYIPVWTRILETVKPKNALKVDMPGLTREAAETSMTTLLDRANIMVDRAVIKTYVAHFYSQEKVSPFAIGLDRKSVV